LSEAERESSVEEELFGILVVENWVEFWKWQSKVMEKKLQETN
jgi:hypothetical protein